MMMLAASPSRLGGLQITAAGGGGLELSWDPAVEEDVTEYLVAWGPEEDPFRNSVRVREPRATIDGTEWVVSVKALNSKGFEGWDWAQGRLER